MRPVPLDLSGNGEPRSPCDVVHARRVSGEPALCGHVGNGGTQKRRWVTCAKCLGEVDRQLAERNRAKEGE
jgi:hypothetical protein